MSSRVTCILFRAFAGKVLGLDQAVHARGVNASTRRAPQTRSGPQLEYGVGSGQGLRVGEKVRVATRVRGSCLGADHVVMTVL